MSRWHGFVYDHRWLDHGGNWGVNRFRATNIEKSKDRPGWIIITFAIFCSIGTLIVISRVIYNIFTNIILYKYFKKCKKLETYISTVITDSYLEKTGYSDFFLINNLNINSQTAVCIFPLKDTVGQMVDRFSQDYDVQPIENCEFYTRTYFKTMLEYSKKENCLLYFIKNNYTFQNNKETENLLIRNEIVELNKKETIIEMENTVDNTIAKNDTNILDNDLSSNENSECKTDFMLEDSSSEENIIDKMNDEIYDPNTFLNSGLPLDTSLLKFGFINPIKMYDRLTYDSLIRSIIELKDLIESQCILSERFIICICSIDEIEMRIYEKTQNQTELTQKTNSKQCSTSMVYLDNILFYFPIGPLKAFVYVLEILCKKATRKEMRNFRFKEI